MYVNLARRLVLLMALMVTSSGSFGCLKVPVFRATLDSGHAVSIAASVHIGITRLNVEPLCSSQAYTLENPDVVYFESAPDDPEHQREVQSAVLQLKLGPSELADYRKSLGNDLQNLSGVFRGRGTEVNRIEELHPYFTFMLAVGECIKTGNQYSIDMAIKRFADGSGIPSRSLEDPVVFFKSVEAIEGSAWISHVSAALRYLDGGCTPSPLDQFDRMYDAYAQGDLANILDYVFNLCHAVGSCLATEKIELSASRDEYLANRIIDLARSDQRVLVVLGAGHLTPQSGVLTALKRSGFTISRQ